MRRALVKHTLMLGVAALALAAPARAATVFKWANDGDVRALDPYTLDETVQNSFLGNIYEGLTRRGKELEPEPALAAKWEQTSPTTWRFHLRPDVKWQDGTPLSADDVLFSFKRINGRNSQLSVEVTDVKEMRKADDQTIEIETKSPDAILPMQLTSMPVMSQKWCTEHDAVENVVVGSGDNYALRNAMGTGPFKLVSREADRRTVVERNPAWWDKPEFNIDQAEFTVISNAATRVAALLSGEVDMVYSVPVQDIDRIKAADGLRLIEGPELRTIFLGMDVSRDQLLFSSVKGKNPFKDARVRQAFALAIDEDAIASRVMRGLARSSWEMWGPGVNGFNPALNARPKPDPAKAKQLLAEAGYPEGFQVQLDCSNDRYVNDAQICTAVSAMLARIGVKADVFARSKVQFFADINLPNYKTSFFMLGWTPSTLDALNVFQNILHTREPGFGIENIGNYSNPKVDALTGQIGNELDNSKRNDLINQGIKAVQDDFAYIPLHQQTIVWATKKDVSVVQTADNYFQLRWVTMK
ncbi:MAG: ABC transporter substrate-binding protein [Acidisphaera sp.]|nr:ABC transporter substrate-binding protein [Acidisphaera sp.]MBV9813118.1 ABC transporter substrate-binding protein [Acetobacteraceae bacterium]